MSGDFDADGRPDLIAAGPEGAVRFAANRTETANRRRDCPARRLQESRDRDGFASRAQGRAPLCEAGLSRHAVAFRPGPGGKLRHDPGDLAERPDPERVAGRPRGGGQDQGGSQAVGLVSHGVYVERASLRVHQRGPRRRAAGASLARGRFFPVDHTEFVTIRGDQLRERDGHLDVRLTEELREVPISTRSDSSPSTTRPTFASSRAKRPRARRSPNSGCMASLRPSSRWPPPTIAARTCSPG